MPGKDAMGWISKERCERGPLIVRQAALNDGF